MYLVEKDTVVCLFVFAFERTSESSGETACLIVFPQGFGNGKLETSWELAGKVTIVLCLNSNKQLETSGELAGK